MLKLAKWIYPKLNNASDFVWLKMIRCEPLTSTAESSVTNFTYKN